MKLSTIICKHYRKSTTFKIVLQRNFTLKEAITIFDVLTSGSESEEIYIEPYDIAVISDEDSANENEKVLTDGCTEDDWVRS
ncbi:hypothetical protein TNCT_706641 [Trichonephila clavata]|uniref:Uncharacterized protein n=1 Tax=Trichonephila clavata TaxID=2740835 RepID=A0A8X6LKT6_TRICU|nr:hypothetical protein TNCT_706641 [Trichonephila clavata]